MGSCGYRLAIATSLAAYVCLISGGAQPAERHILVFGSGVLEGGNVLTVSTLPSPRVRTEAVLMAVGGAVHACAVSPAGLTVLRASGYGSDGRAHQIVIHDLPGTEHDPVGIDVVPTVDCSETRATIRGVGTYTVRDATQDAGRPTAPPEILRSLGAPASPTERNHA